MTPSKLSEKVIVERSAWVQEMLEELRALPVGSFDEFSADRRNVHAAESCLRRALEALLDLGRHLLAKGYGDAPAEYRAVAQRLGERGALGGAETRLFAEIAGYRNRLVHFYDRVSEEELYRICTERLRDVEQILGAIHDWIRAHPERIDSAI